MSLLEKLKDLVAAVEEDVPEKEESEENLEENDSVGEIADYLECTEGQSLEVRNMLREVELAKAHLADLVIQFESQKQLVFDKISKDKETTRLLIASLSEALDLPEGYILRIPGDPDKNVFFVKN